MPIMDIVIAIIIIAFLVWAVRLIIGVIPMDAWLKQVVEVLLMILVGAIIVFYILVPLLHMLASHIPTSIHFLTLIH